MVYKPGNFPLLSEAKARALSAAFFGLALTWWDRRARRFHFLEIRRLVRLLFCPVTVSIGRVAQENQRMQDFRRSNHDVVTTEE